LTARTAQSRRTAFTERTILDAAEVVFSRRGLEGTRVREIAEAAGVNGATLYNYYPSKSALYEAVLERGMKPMISLLERFAASSHELESVRELVGDVMAHLAGHPHFARLLYLEAMAEGEFTATLARRWFGPLAAGIVRELKDAPLPAGLGEGLHPLVAALFLHLTFGHFAMAPLLEEVFDIDPLSPASVERQTRFIDALILQMFPQLSGDCDVASDEEDAD
jgi:AcrR family transcriptional regulator